MGSSEDAAIKPPGECSYSFGGFFVLPVGISLVRLTTWSFVFHVELTKVHHEKDDRSEG